MRSGRSVRVVSVRRVEEGFDVVGGGDGTKSSLDERLAVGRRSFGVCETKKKGRSVNRDGEGGEGDETHRGCTSREEEPS